MDSEAQDCMMKGGDSWYKTFIITAVWSYDILLSLPYSNSLFDMPILGFSISAVNKGMMSKLWTNVDTIF